MQCELHFASVVTQMCRIGADFTAVNKQITFGKYTRNEVYSYQMGMYTVQKEKKIEGEAEKKRDVLIAALILCELTVWRKDWTQRKGTVATLCASYTEYTACVRTHF